MTPQHIAIEIFKVCKEHKVSISGTIKVTNEDGRSYDLTMRWDSYTHQAYCSAEATIDMKDLPLREKKASVI